MKYVIVFSLWLVLILSAPFAQAQPYGQRIDKEMIQKLHKEFYNGAEIYFERMLAGNERRYKSVMTTIEPYVDFFSRQDYRKIKEWEKPILDLVKEGKFEDAIAEYETRDLISSYRAGSEEYGCIKRYSMLLEMSGVRDQALKGLDILREVTNREEFGNTLRPMSTIINLALDLRLGSVAEDYYFKFKERADKSKNPKLVAECLGFRTQMLFRRNRPNEAMVIGRQSIELFDSICAADQNEDFELLARARVHLAMAKVCQKLQEREACAKNTRASYLCFQKEAEKDGDVNMIERIRALYTLGPIAAEMNEFFLADSIFTELDGLGLWLYEEDQFHQAEFKFNALRFRGLTAYRVGKHVESRTYFDQASEILNQMEELSPGENLEHHQNLNFNIASLYYQEGNYEMAMKYNKKVLELVLNDKVHDERKRNYDLSYCYKYIGNCLWAMAYQKYEKAKKRKTQEVMNLYYEASKCYGAAIDFNPSDSESQSKYNMCDYILSGMQKPIEKF